MLARAALLLVLLLSGCAGGDWATANVWGEPRPPEEWKPQELVWAAWSDGGFWYVRARMADGTVVDDRLMSFPRDGVTPGLFQNPPELRQLGRAPGLRAQLPPEGAIWFATRASALPRLELRGNEVYFVDGAGQRSVFSLGSYGQKPYDPDAAPWEWAEGAPWSSLALTPLALLYDGFGWILTPFVGLMIGC